MVEKLKKLKEHNSSSYIAVVGLLVSILFLPVSIFIFKDNPNTYHLITELLVIIMCFSIVIVTNNTWSISRNMWFKSFGAYFIVICIFNIFHVICSHEGQALRGYAMDLSYVFDLYESAIRGIAKMLFVALGSTTLMKKPIGAKKVYTAVFIITALLLTLIFFNKVPKIFIPQNGTYNIYGQILIVVINITGIIIILKKRKDYKPNTVVRFFLTFVLSAISDIMPILDIKYMHISDFVANYFKLLSIYFTYSLIVKNLFSIPVQYLNNELVAKNKELTSLVEELNKKNERVNRITKYSLAREKSYKNVIANLPISIVLRQGETLVFGNSAANKLFKRKDNHLGGRSYLDFVHPDYLEKARSNYEAIRHGEMVISCAGKLLNYDNEPVDVETTIIPIMFNDKETDMIVIRNMKDVKLTEKIKQELQLAKENEKLYTDSFANFYHEFRTPLNVIYTSSQMVEMYTARGSIENVEKYNKLIKQNCFRISKLINNIIDSTRINDGFYYISLSKVDFVSVVEDTVLSVSSYLEKNSVEIIFDTDIEEKYIMVDEEKIERILLNLISNSVKYRRSEGALIEVRLYDGKDSITLSFKDNGIGISEAKQKVVFNRFIKVDKSLNRKQEGSGLGLYIVKSLVELHGGTIELKSKENVGTEFIIKLPIIYTEAPVAEKRLIETKSIEEKIKVEFSDIYDYEA